ncbi:MAG: tRNA preQ1(34) S-adenosylmethionine ribosyltransferase-isomerase QueA [Deltaproteobacteria bacterium]|nr:tRNA preQ1(34) S-adenosylmethionine ribosyltransferase-isomerase QueA [Deltaproteobacteria bacterium]
MTFNLSNYTFNFPDSLIAHHPLLDRTQSKLMVLNKHKQAIAHRAFIELPEILNSNTVIVLNESRVFPARLYCRKPTGGVVEVLLVRPIENGRWLALGQPIKGLRVGMSLKLLFRDSEETSDAIITVVRVEKGQHFEVELPPVKDLETWIKPYGIMPLPLYIKRKNSERQDENRYQTVFARQLGSVAAPTAGLHFDESTLAQLTARGVEIYKVCLHVGPGTFLSVKTEDIRQHKLHSEYYEVSEASYQGLKKAKYEGKSILCVGTTTLRVLETLFQQPAPALQGFTDLYIYPGFSFKAADALLTNFHQPQSSLLILVSALAGREFILRAYQEAIAQKYRLFSYGDCMLIL